MTQQSIYKEVERENLISPLRYSPFLMPWVISNTQIIEVVPSGT